MIRGRCSSRRVCSTSLLDERHGRSTTNCCVDGQIQKPLLEVSYACPTLDSYGGMLI